MGLFLNSSSCRRGRALAVMAVCAAMTTFAWGADVPTALSNMGSIANTRHNMTFSGSLYQRTMDNGRNDYQEVCVYCHTPHGANTTIAVPLWNRTIRATSYTAYNSASLTQTVSQPGTASLTCLSCHDGQTAIDSIINMPGSGQYLSSQQTTQNIAFLNSWNNATSGYVPVPGAGDTLSHKGMNSDNTPLGGVYRQGIGDGSDGIGCLACHSDVGLLGGSAHDMRIAFIGTDLSNDHPVGVTFPAANGPGTDWNTPAGMVGSSIYFDTNSNSRMDKAEIRTYDGKVECASCHDPHGVPSAGSGSMFNPTFLRVSNTGSAVCLTCHAK